MKKLLSLMLALAMLLSMGAVAFATLDSDIATISGTTDPTRPVVSFGAPRKVDLEETNFDNWEVITEVKNGDSFVLPLMSGDGSISESSINNKAFIGSYSGSGEDFLEYKWDSYTGYEAANFSGGTYYLFTVTVNKAGAAVGDYVGPINGTFTFTGLSSDCQLSSNTVGLRLSSGSVTPPTPTPTPSVTPGAVSSGKVIDHFAFFEDDLKGRTWNTSSAPLFGDKIYAVPLDAAGNVVNIPFDETKKLKVSDKWDTNGSLVKSVEWESAIASIGGKESGKSVIAIEFVEKSKETDTKDVIGTLTLKDSSKDYSFTGAAKEMDVDAAFTLSNEKLTGDAALKTTDETKVHHFTEDEEAEIELFGGAGKFVVNTIGQSDLVIDTNVEYCVGLENVSPDTVYTYFNANNATFNRLGYLYLFADEGDFIYRVNNNGTLAEVKAPYDEDEEAFKIRTRVIGSYVISEKELDIETVNSKIPLNRDSLGASSIHGNAAAVNSADGFIPTNPATGAEC